LHRSSDHSAFAAVSVTAEWPRQAISLPADGCRGLTDTRSESSPYSASVCIPTYRRPDYLKRAVRSVLAQTHAAAEIIIVSGQNDEPTNAAILGLMAEHPRAGIRNPRVSEPGFLPPVRRAVEDASGDIIVLLDDDAEAHPDWLERVLSHYREERIGGVGGRCINYSDGVLQTYPPASAFGHLSWFGRSVGNMYRDATFDHPVEVCHLMGGNMSFRADLFRECLPDPRIGNNVAFYWEMDVGLQVKRRGFRILYDPAAKIDHHSAPRETTGMRTVNADAIYWSNYNYALLMRKHLGPARFLAYLAYTGLIGGSFAPGLAYLAIAALRGKPLSWKLQVKPSVLGRWGGLRA